MRENDPQVPIGECRRISQCWNQDQRSAQERNGAIAPDVRRSDPWAPLHTLAHEGLLVAAERQTDREEEHELVACVAAIHRFGDR